MENADNTKSEVKSWLKIVLSKQKLDGLSVEILGNSEKGDGYVGDIIFARVTAKTAAGLPKEYNLVLKCGKRSLTLREASPVKEAFENEIFIYDVLLPAFTQFQLEKGISETFNSVPKCYGTLVRDTMEVIVLENLKQKGYILWDKKKPLTRNHIEMVLGEYAKLHATSLVMDIEKPEVIKAFDRALFPILLKFMETMDGVFEQGIDDIADALKDELDETIILKWRNFKQQVTFIFKDLYGSFEGKKVIGHGDCWSNNFLFKHSTDGTYRPLKVAILDWQLAKYTSPIFDLSYHIFATISENDIENLDSILRYYHTTLSNYLKKFGYDVDSLYPLDEFLQEWKKFCKFGVLMASAVMKAASTEKDEVIDMAQAAESSGSINQAFAYKLRDNTVLKKRMRCIVKYAVDNDII